jgi:hypothetical protein
MRPNECASRKARASSRAVVLAGLAATLLLGCAGLGTGTMPIQGDFLVAALGDSYASGQGAPNEPSSNFCGPKWDDKRCNRSSHAATRRAVEMRVAAGDSMGFETFACSGATIETGLIGGQDGPEPDPGDPKLPAQVDALKALAQGLPAGQELDAVSISIGGNDVWFQNIVLACIADECQFSHLIVEQKLAALPAKLDLLAAKLATVPGLSHSEVLLVEYPDPTRRDTSGTLCDGEPPFPPELFGRISASDSHYASSFVLPALNHHLCEAAKRHGWLWLEGAVSAFEGHGWCAGDQRWINTTIDSIAIQGSHRGAMHPKPAGHAAIGATIADVLGQMAAGSAPAPPTACPPAPAPPGP